MNFEEFQQKQLSQMSHTERAQHEAIVKQLKASHAADPGHHGYLRDRWVKELEALDPKPVEAEPRRSSQTDRDVPLARQCGGCEAVYQKELGDCPYCATQHVVLVDAFEYNTGALTEVVAPFGSTVVLGEVMFAETIEEHVAAGLIAPLSECYKVLKKFAYYKAEGGAAARTIAKPGQYLHPSKWAALNQPSLEAVAEAGWVKKC